jgi:uncharacterized protein YqfA (UPF0365 family)
MNLFLAMDGTEGWLWVTLLVGISMVGLLAIGLFVFVFSRLIGYWVQAYMCGADISAKSLIVMRLLQLDVQAIVNAKIMATQSGMSIERLDGMSTDRLLAHQLTGGDITKVILACIAAKQANIDLDFQRAAAIDLAGRDVLLAVQTSISPRIIRCPPNVAGGSKTLSAVARNGIEILADARVTVRTELDQLVGGATEETIIARVGQAIIAAIGSTDSHVDVLAMPSNISRGLMQLRLDKNTAFTIVSIDIYHLVVGKNIGARLQSDQADADVRIARAEAEGRLAEAVATTQQMKARIVENRAALVLAEALVPRAIASSFISGKIANRTPSPSVTPLPIKKLLQL